MRHLRRDQGSSGVTAIDVRRSGLVKVQAMYRAQSYVRPWDQPQYSMSKENFQEQEGWAAALCVDHIWLNGKK